MSKSINLRCKIGRGAFSGERIATLDKLGYVGIAPVHYFRTHTGGLLDESVPQKDLPIDGSIRARLVDSQEQTVVVAMPDGEVLEADLGAIRELVIEAT